MKVLLNGLQIGNNNSGIQYYTKHLYNAIQKIHSVNFEVHLYRKNTKLRFPFSLFLLPVKSRLFRILNENILLPNYLKNHNYNLYHSPNYILPFFIKTPSIVTIHDLITFDFPKLCQWESVWYFKIFLPRSIKKAHKIITVSETVKKDIISRFNISKNKVIVIPLGVSEIFKRTINTRVISKYCISGKYILFVGNIEPKKNLIRLIKAYNQLISEKNISHQLVIAGKKGWKYKEVFSIVQRLKLQNRVIFTGYVPEKDLPELYSMADIFVFPSIYEGFGIPPLEAMACETPVMVSNTGSLPETTGGNCAMVDPFNIDDIANNIYRMLTNESLRRNCIEKGLEWVKHYDWIEAAQKTLKVYDEIKYSN